MGRDCNQQAEKVRRENEALEKARQEKESLTFGQFFRETYYPPAKRDKKPMSHLTEWGHFKNWIEPAIGGIPLKDLRPLHLEGDSPTKAVKKPKVENKRVRFLTTNEAQTLLEDLQGRDPATYRMAFISLFAGLRAGEVFGLKWKNLDQGNGLLWVMDGKSGKSRPVYLPEPVKALFEEMTTGKPEDLIFPGPREKAFPQITRLFDRAVKK